MVILHFSDSNNKTADCYFYDGNIQMSSNMGYVARVSGSIIGVTCRTYIQNTLSGTYYIESRVNGNTSLYAQNVSPGHSGYQSTKITANRNEYKFNEGDIISVYYNKVSGSYYLTQTMITVELQLDN